MSKRAVIYARISRDRDGERAGVTRQLEDCRALVQHRGWTVVGEFVDNSISAYAMKKRPDYQAMVAAVEAGTVDVVVCWHPDRLTRSPRELEDLLDLIESRQITVASVQAGDVDLSTPSGRAVARTLVAWGKHESEHKGQRQRRSIAEAAKAGKRHGFVPYGWRCDEEAAVVREIVARLLGGESLRSISRDLNARGVQTTRGGQWSVAQVRQLAARWSNAGVRTHKGVVTGEGEWPALVTRGEQEQVMRMLADPARRTSRDGGQRHLLSGLLRCGRCGAPMRHSRVDQRRTIYRCEQLHLTVVASPVEQWVLETMQARLDAPDAAGVAEPAGQARADLEEALGQLQSRLDKLADDYADGVLDAAQMKRAGERLRVQVSEISGQLAALDRTQVAHAQRGVIVADLTLERQRALLRGLMTVTVAPAASAGRGFDYGRLQVEWL